MATKTKPLKNTEVKQAKPIDAEYNLFDAASFTRCSTHAISKLSLDTFNQTIVKVMTLLNIDESSEIVLHQTDIVYSGFRNK